MTPFHRPSLSPRQRRAQAENLRYVAQAVDAATHFTATIFCRHGYLTETHATLADARAAGPSLERQANNGRRAMVYAVTADGFTHFVPAFFNQGEKR